MDKHKRAIVSGFLCGAIAMQALAGYGKINDTPAHATQQPTAAAAAPAKTADTAASDAATPSIAETRAIVEQAYIYGFPMIAAYKAMYEFTIDKSSSQYKGPFNQIWSDARTFTPKDTAVVTPNADTPYSTAQADLRAEPVVLCVPAVDKKRYYSVQLIDMYTFNYGYVGSRTTGNDAGCYLIAGPNWQGETPEGIARVFHSETDFSLLIFRTQLFNPADMDNVKKIQAGYKLQTLSAFLGQPAPPPAPEVDWPKFAGDAPFTTEFPAYLSFLLQFAPATGPAAEEEPLREKFASIGIDAGKPFDFKALSPEQQAAYGEAIKGAVAKIDEAANKIGRNINGWQAGSAWGDRAFYNGDWLLRAAGAKAGIFGNDAAEAVYLLTRSDAQGQPLDGSKHAYTLTFARDKLPPVNAFWSVTMYDGKTQLLVENPINRYLINAPMLPTMKKNADGSLTLYIQKDSPGEGKESNWLPSPDGPIYLNMRLYWPTETPPSILPPGAGTWDPPGIKQVQ